MYLRTLKTLQDLQAAAASRPAEQPSEFVEQPPDTPVSEPPSPMPTQPLKPPIGFVPPNTPASGEPPHLSQVRLLTPPKIDFSALKNLLPS